MCTTTINNYEGGNRLMLITHRTDTRTEYQEAEAAIQGGCTWIQLRMKGTLNLEDARQLADLCREKHVRLCIDDNVEIALAAGATAVHLGKNDMPVDEAWKLVRKQGNPEGFLIGATANTFEDIRQAALKGASYIGLGPFRFTQTKEKLSPVLGLEGYRDILRQCRLAGINLPVYAIGGIELEDVPELMKTGITGIAVSGAINRADDPTAMTAAFLKCISANETFPQKDGKHEATCPDK